MTASDGQLSASDVFSLMVGNFVLAKPLDDQTVLEDTVWTFQLPAGTFADATPATPLTYKAALAGGAALPSWLTFNGLTRTFSGTPPKDFTGAISLQVTAADGSLNRTDLFVLTVAPVNDAPFVAAPVADQSVLEEARWIFALPAGTFKDVDSTGLTYSATLATGAALPDWLTFNPITRYFSGTPPKDFNGVLDIRVVARDDKLLPAADTFRLTVNPVNDRPVLAKAILDQTVAEDAPWTFLIPAGTFADVDRDLLTYTVTQSDGTALPAWLRFDAGTRSLIGTPPKDWTGSLQFKVTASDGKLTAYDLFSLKVLGVNDAPVVTRAMADVSVAEDTRAIFRVPAGTFTDTDSPTLTYTAVLSTGAALPSWLLFNPLTQVFSGTPPKDFTGALDIRVIASDGRLKAFDQFRLTVTGVNDAPTIAKFLADAVISEKQFWFFVLPANTFADPDNKTLTYTVSLADGTPLPDWLSFDALTGTFYGTPPTNLARAYDIKVTASDAVSSVSDTFHLEVVGVNEAPVITRIIADRLKDQFTAQGSTRSFTLPDNAFTDIDGDTLTYTATLADGTALPAWLTFDAATRTFTGTAPADWTDALDIKVTASDGKLSVSDTFTLRIEGRVFVAVGIDDMAVLNDRPWSFQFADETFAREDLPLPFPPTLVYRATLADGAPLPSWLAFDGGSRTFSGTPPQGWAGTLDIKVGAETILGVAAETFRLTVGSVIAARPANDQTTPEDTAWSYQLPADTFAAAGSAALAYTASLESGAPLPTWVKFNAATRTFSGTPPEDWSGELNLKVTASNGVVSASDVFTLTVGAVNDMPLIAKPLVDQGVVAGVPWTFTLPAGTVTDADNPSLRYSATLASGDALPTWLTFNALTKTFSGVPPQGMAALEIKIWADDGEYIVSDTFRLTSSNFALAQPIPDTILAEDSAWTFTVPEGTFGDATPTTKPSYAASLSSGAALPAWLTFDAATRTFSGTPPKDFASALVLKVTATDGNLSASDTFILRIGPVNDAPVLAQPILDQGVATNKAWTFAVPTGTFTDADNASLAYTATQANGLALPTWLRFDPATRVFSGTPPTDFKGLIGLKVTASDGKLSASDSFYLRVDDLVVASPVADQAGIEDRRWTLRLPPDLFGDADATTPVGLTVTLGTGAPLPAWLVFTSATATLSGIPPRDFAGTLSLKVTALDGARTVSDTFLLTIQGVNDAPILTRALADQTIAEDAHWSFVLPATTFLDVDNALTYTAGLATGGALPGWLAFDARTRTFSGTPPKDWSGTLAITVKAGDGTTLASDTFNLTVTAVNDAPVVAAPLPDQILSESTPWSFKLPAGMFTDAETPAGLPEAPLTYTATLANGAALPTWLKFDPATKTFSGTPPKAGAAGALDIKVTASDGQLSASDSFLLSINPINLAKPVADQLVLEDRAWSFALPAGTFVDVDGSPLTYTATLGNGAALPSWLTFNAATKTFAGTSPTPGALEVKVTASDGTFTRSDVFSVTTRSVLLDRPLADQTVDEDRPWTFKLPTGTFGDADPATPLTTTAKLANGEALPTWLAYNPALQTFSGTPPRNFAGALDILVTAGDGTTNVSDTFRLTVAPVNDAPVLVTPLADRVTQGNAPWSYKLPAGSFADVDNPALVYTAKLASGAALPSWLTFNAATQTFSGKPPKDWFGVSDITVTASDGKLTASDTFRLTRGPEFDLSIVNGNAWGKNAPRDISWTFDEFHFSAGDEIRTNILKGDFRAEIPGWGPFPDIYLASGGADIDLGVGYETAFGPLIDFKLESGVVNVDYEFDVLEKVATIDQVIDKKPFVIPVAQVSKSLITTEGSEMATLEARFDAFFKAGAFIDAEVWFDTAITPTLSYDKKLYLGIDLDASVDIVDMARGAAGGVVANINKMLDDFGELTVQLPDRVDTVNNRVSQVANGLGVLSSEGVSDNFVQASADLDKIAAYLLGKIPLVGKTLAQLLTDEVSYDFEIGKIGLEYETFGADLVGGAAIKETFDFKPVTTAVMRSQYGETVTGKLGDKFEFNTPEGEGSFKVDATYATTATLTSKISLRLAGTLDYRILSIAAFAEFGGYEFDLGRLAVDEETIDLAAIDVTLHSSTDTFDYGSYKDDFSMVYEKFRTSRPISEGGSGDNFTLTTHQILVDGNANANAIIGNAFDNVMYGFGGNDRLTGLGGSDVLDGGDGEDTLVGGDGNDTLIGGEGTDQLLGGAGINTIKAGGGNETITTGNDGSDIDGGAGEDTITAGAGDDTITGGDGHDIIRAGEGNNYIVLGTGLDELTVGGGDDTIIGSHEWENIKALEGNNRVESGAGNDTITAGAGADFIFAGEGNDLVQVGEGNNSVDLGSGTNTVTVGSGNDTIRGGDGGNRISVGDGANQVYVGGGNDTVDGGNGPNDVELGSGIDTLTLGFGNDTVRGGGGNDNINVGEGANYVDGGDENDTVVVGAGNDTIIGGAGNDTINAGEGLNDISPGTGSDHVTTGGGSERIIEVGEGNDTLLGGHGANYIYAAPGNDYVEAGDGNDSLGGGGGDDIISGGGGNDEIYGSGGSDRIIGGAGNDTLAGNPTGDLVVGGWDSSFDDFAGPHNDVFAFGVGSGRDLILDFRYAEDRIDLTGYAWIRSMDDLVITDVQGHNFSENALIKLTETDSIELYLVRAGDFGVGNFINPTHFIFNTDPYTDPGRTINGTTNSETLRGRNGPDVINGNGGWDTLNGLEGNDTLTGADGNDTIYGGENEDVINGASGYDYLQGDGGNDNINGGEGQDTLNGGTGADVLTGGGWSDRFVFTSVSESPTWAPDQITDFRGDGIEQIDLSQIDANVNGWGDQWFVIENGNGVIEAGELGATVNGSTVELWLSTDNDGQWDSKILVLNRPVISGVTQGLDPFLDIAF